ncbi:methyltransferase-like protein 24 [Mizuhopecten yessoensis]|uniref:Methyltransferase-like protein 24 n=1 Tax=Mizuhopecten yessoensis TaxID=6573 RepID=A0A210PRU8_MIZYE|nr:methyltransferase-like protein 24 [Mizuhopecten yessoensis]OWF39220.1 Methyltransferase-like protein 24 [Mizuhopecten yessoensis]
MASKSFIHYLRRYRSRNARMWILIATAVGSFFLLFQHRYSGIVLVELRPTSFNRTWWDAKSYPKESAFSLCSSVIPTRHNVSLTGSLKKTMEIGDGPPPVRDKLCSMSFEDLEMYYHTYLSTIQRPCKRSVRMGHTMDGGWDVCGEEFKYIRNECLVYSFGIQFDFSFDDEMASVFGCEVHSFDPSMHEVDHVHNPSVYFHATGLSDYNGISKDMAGWKMRTFKSIRKELFHNSRTPDILKMDIESWEWNVLPDMLKTSQLDGVKQLLVEFHARTESRVKEYWVHKLLILRGLYLEGYRVFWVGRNMMCTYTSPALNRTFYGCYEVSFVKVNIPGAG